MRDVRTERAKPHFQRAQRTGVSLSDDLFVQLTSFMASLIPSLAEVRKIGINHRTGARSSPGRRSCFLFEDAIDTLATDPDALGDVLFVISLSIELPHPLMDGHPLAMTSTTLLFPDLWYGSSGSRPCFSCNALCPCFERAFCDARTSPALQQNSFASGSDPPPAALVEHHLWLLHGRACLDLATRSGSPGGRATTLCSFLPNEPRAAGRLVSLRGSPGSCRIDDLSSTPIHLFPLPGWSLHQGEEDAARDE